MGNIAVKLDHDLEVMHCCVCAVVFALPAGLVAAARRNSQTLFYCPNGHGQGFRKSEADTLREELAAAQARAKAAEARPPARTPPSPPAPQVKPPKKRPKKRVGGGVCPHCGRSYRGLLMHIRQAHPEIAASGKDTPATEERE